jgi:multidrug efflux system membrane fusion protein
MTSRRRQLAIAIVAVLLFGGAIYYLSPWQPAQQSQRGKRGTGVAAPGEAVPVLASAARTADVPVYLDGVGTARALNTVTVRPQIEGKLISVAFREGQDVEKGYVLAKIDPTIYQALYDQAVAKKAQDDAQLANARLDLDRYTRLAASNAINKQQVDTQRALVNQLQAQVKADQAAIENAKAVLDYTNVIAPISGRVGLRLVDEGNIVKPSDTAGIVVINQIRPISVLFNLPQQDLPEINRGLGEGPLPVDALRADGKTALDKGTVVVVDNQVDQTTGTVRLRAEFPNAQLQIWPGQFVNVRLLIDTKRNVVVVPTAAVQRGPNGTFAFVVTPEDTVVTRPITISQQDDVQSVIATGLQAGERVITSGFARLTEGSKVQVTNADEYAPPAPAAGTERQQGKGTARGKRGEGKGKAPGAGAPQSKQDSGAPPGRTP